MLEILSIIIMILVIINVALISISIYSFDLRYDKKYNYVLSGSYLITSITYVFGAIYGVDKFALYGIFIWLIIACLQFSKAINCND